MAASVDFSTPPPNLPSPALNEKFHEYIVIDLQEKYDFHNCRSTFYFILSVASVVALVAIAVLTLVSCIDAPAFIPLVMVAVGALTGSYYHNITESLIETYRMHSQERECIENIQREITRLPDTANFLKGIGISPPTISSDTIKNNLTHLNPLIARYRVYENELQLQQQTSQARLQEFHTTADPAQKFAKMRDYLISKEDNENFHRLHLAYIHHIIRFPTDQRPLSAFVSSDTDAVWRALSARAGLQNADVIFKLKLQENAALTRTEVEEMSIVQLSNRIFETA